MKLTHKLPLLLIPLIAAPLLVVGAVMYYQLKNDAEQKNIEQASVLLNRIGTRLDRSIDIAKANVELIADDQLIKKYLLTDDEEERYSLLQRPLEQKFVSLQLVYPDYFELRVILPDGFEDIRVVSPWLANKTEEEGSTAYFNLLRAAPENLLLRMRVNPDNDKLALYVSKRISLINPATDAFNASTTLRGFLLMSIDLDPLIAEIAEVSWAGEGGLVLTDPAGKIWINGGGTDNTLQRHKTSAEEAMPTLPNNQQFRDIQLAGQTFLHKQIALKSGFGLHALLPESTILAASRQAAVTVASVLLLALVCAVPVLIIILTSQILAPIQRLRAALANVGSTSALVTVPVIGRDEFSELNTAFNTMSVRLQQSHQQIENLAYSDALTGLPNRLMFFRSVQHEMELAKQEGFCLALLFIDLDNFKHINDTLGHAAGDTLLQQVAKRITANLRGSDYLSRSEAGACNATLARLGGDEFTVLLSQLASAAVAAQVAQRIINILSLPVKIDEQEYYIGASIGIAAYPNDGATLEELLKNADLAMYHAKQAGKNTYQCFSAAIGAQSNKRVQLDQKLHTAIENGAFELVYQPIVDCQNSRACYLEALIRWNDPELGFIPPDVFIPLAEESGKIIAIGEWVIEEAIRQLNQWHAQGLDDIKVAINVSGVQLGKPCFVDHLRRVLLAQKVAPQSVYVELTETAIIEGTAEVVDTLQQLHDLGIRIALDDFGTGYSSLSYLTNLPIDVLKIDRSFIAKIDEKENSTLLSAIITMAHSLNLEVVAEGIEEQYQSAFLKREHCDYMQGYLFSKPLSATAIADYLTDRESQGRLTVVGNPRA